MAAKQAERDTNVMQELLKRYWWTLAAGLMILILAFSLIDPPPPRHVIMAGGSDGGAYAATGRAYAAAMEQEGVTLDVLETRGSVDNLERLLAGQADVAIVQTGVASAAQAERLYSLGAVYLEPLWVFHRTESPLHDLRDLKGLRVAVGAPGSGARALADVLLQDNGVTDGVFTPLDMGGREAAEALMDGRADAALIVAGPDSTWINALVAAPGVELMSMPRALAYARRHPYLKDIVLPDGVLSLEGDLPAEDVRMASPAAQIVVRRDLHPAINALMLDVMFATHRGGSLLAPPGDFPTPDLADMKLSDEARRYYERGPSFLRRYFSFGVANFLDRAWVLVIPLATLMFPIVKAAPPLYRWRIKRKIYVWYRDLRQLEEEGRAAETAEERREIRLRLAALQAETGKVEVPDSYTDDLYRLRSHIRFVAELVERLNTEDTAQRV